MVMMFDATTEEREFAMSVTMLKMINFNQDFKFGMIPHIGGFKGSFWLASHRLFSWHGGRIQFWLQQRKEWGSNTLGVTGPSTLST